MSCAYIKTNRGRCMIRLCGPQNQDNSIDIKEIHKIVKIEIEELLVNEIEFSGERDVEAVFINFFVKGIKYSNVTRDIVFREPLTFNNFHQFVSSSNISSNQRHYILNHFYLQVIKRQPFTFNCMNEIGLNLTTTFYSKDFYYVETKALSNKPKREMIYIMRRDTP